MKWRGPVESMASFPGSASPAFRSGVSHCTGSAGAQANDATAIRTATIDDERRGDAGTSMRENSEHSPSGEAAERIAARGLPGVAFLVGRRV
jgi:hypothetical protein